MNNDQREQIRPFTFYNQNEELQDKIDEQLCIKDTKGKEECFFNVEQKQKKCKALRKMSKKRSDVGLLGRFVGIRKQSEISQNKSRESTASNNYDHVIEKTQKREGKLTRLIFKKTQSFEQNSQHLKAHLKELLKNDNILIQTQEEPTIQESKSCLPIKPPKQCHNLVDRSQAFTSPIRISENLSLGKMESREKILLLHAPKNDRNNLRNFICSKNMEQIKKKMTEQLFPNISKKSHSIKMKSIDSCFQDKKVRKEVQIKTRYKNPDRHDEQSYLQPVKTDRNTRKKPYIINIENLHPQDLTHSATEKGTTKITFHSECEHSDNRLLLQAAKCIRFK